MASAIAITSETWQFVKLVLLIGSPVLVPLMLFVYVKLIRRWPIKAIIWERRADNALVETYDRLRKVIDRDGLVKYKFKKQPTDNIPVVNYDWVVNTAERPTNIFEKISSMLGTTVGTIHLYKYGNKQYKPINVKATFENLDFEVIDWDNMNFVMQEQRSIIERTQKKEDWRSKYLVPLALVGAAVVVFIIATYYASELWTKGQASCEPLIRAAVGESQVVLDQATNTNVPVFGELFGPQGTEQPPGG